MDATTRKLIANLVETPEDNESIMEKLAKLSKKDREKVLEEIVAKKYPEIGFPALKYDWDLWARPDQMSYKDLDWEVWKNLLVMGGRGMGKTRMGSEFVRWLAENKKVERIALVGATNGDVNKVMIGGVSGILSVCPPWNMPYHSPTHKRLTWPNGVIAEYFSAEQPERLRGPQFGAAWLDEFCLVSGTRIKTDSGSIPVEFIETGTTVITRVGPKKVTKAWKTSDSARTLTLNLSNNKTLTCTGGHPIYTKRRGILPAVQVSLGDSVYTYDDYIKKCESLKLLKQQVLSLPNIKTELFQKQYFGETIGGTFIMGTTNLGKESYFTGLCSNSGLVSLPEVLTFITLMEMVQITQYLIYLQFQEDNTQDSTLLGSPEAFRLLTERHGQNIPETLGKLKNLESVNAFLVEENFYLLDKLLNCAQIRVEKPSIKNFIEFQLRESAKSVERTLSVIEDVNYVLENVLHTSQGVRDLGTALCALDRTMLKTHILKLALDHVDINTDPVSVLSIDYNDVLSPVYNLEVEDEHNYFANNVLVSNCAWNYQKSTYDMLSFGLRTVDFPKLIITTTPKPQKLFIDIVKDTRTYTVVGNTVDNKANLGKEYIHDIVDKYSGTRIGRQELEANILLDTPGSLWNMTNIDENRVARDNFGSLPEFTNIVLAVDPAMTAVKNSAETGICVAAYGKDGNFYILHADSVKETPSGWSKLVLSLYDEFLCDEIVVETNQGGDIVTDIITQARPHINIVGVHATRSKVLRAEPIANLYERRKVHHVGYFSKAEDQMINFNPLENTEGLKDCVDSLVYALTALVSKTNAAYVSLPSVGGQRTKLVSYRYR